MKTWVVLQEEAAAGFVRGLEGMSCEDWLRELVLPSLEKRRLSRDLCSLQPPERSLE